MPQRVRLVLVGVFACLFAGFAGVWAASFKAAGDSHLKPDRAVGYSGAARPPGAKVPDFRLRDQDGHRDSTPDKVDFKI